MRGIFSISRRPTSASKSKKKGIRSFSILTLKSSIWAGKAAKKTNKVVSESGKQITGIRIDSEQKYHWKNFGILRLYSVVYTEIIWNFFVILKNRLLNRNISETKIRNAQLVIELHRTNLKNKNYRNTGYNYEN